jgi:integrase/recombinase XerD
MKYSPTFRFVHNRTKKLNKHGTAIIQLEASYRGKRKFLSTGIFVKPSEWNGTVIRHKDSVYLNNQLSKFLDRCRRYTDTTDEFSLEGLENYLKGSDPDSFIEFFGVYLDTKKDIEDSTRRQYNSALTHLKDFGLIQTFADVTYENIFKFDQFLVSLGLSPQTRRSIHKRIKMVANHAFYSRRMMFNDYESFKLPRLEDGEIRYLTEQELEKLKTKDLHTDRLNRVRDIFLFQCYTGLAYVDIEKLTPQDITIENGDKWIITDRIKTGVTSEIFLLNPALQLIEKYEGGEKLFPVPSLQNLNAYLGEIQELCGIETHLTSHVARHTCATTMLNNDVDIYDIARTLGHKSIKTTERYAKRLRAKMAERMKELNKKLK